MTSKTVIPLVAATQEDEIERLEKIAKVNKMLRGGGGSQGKEVPPAVELTPVEQDEVEAAQLVVEQTQEKLAELQQEYKQVADRQSQLGAKDVDEFYQLEKRRGELPLEIRIAEEMVTLAQIDRLNARRDKAKRVLAELQPHFDEQQRKTVEAQQRLNAISMQMYSHQMTLRSYSIDIGALNKKLSQQRARAIP